MRKIKKNLRNITLIVFLISFIGTTFRIVTTKTQSSNPQLSTLDFNQQFIGIAEVIDGDSLRIRNDNIKYEVRLFGIDAPEFKQNCFDKNDKEYSCGQISKNFLLKLADKKEVLCSYAQKDVYNRYLAICKIDNLVINEEIIKNGMAIIYNLKQADENLINLENLAKVNKLGVWQGKFQTPKDYRKSHKKK